MSERLIIIAPNEDRFLEIKPGNINDLLLNEYFVMREPGSGTRLEYEEDLKNAYENAVNDFINRKRKDIYIYHSYSDEFGGKVPCLVFADQYIAFKVHGNIEKEGFPDYLKPIIKWSSRVDNPVVSFRKTEEAYLGTHIELVASLVPLPQNEYMYYYELMCDHQPIHFKSERDNITLYDFYQRDKKIYFVLRQGNDMILFEYDRL
jgi:hypothetical protein